MNCSVPFRAHMAMALYICIDVLGFLRINTQYEPRAPSSTSFVGGIHAFSFSAGVARSITPCAENSDVNLSHVVRAPLKYLTSNGLRYGRSSCLLWTAVITSGLSHSFPSIAPVL